MQLQTKHKIKGPYIVDVLENIMLSEGIYKLVLRNKTIADNAQPGQFVSILCEDLILRRPFSVANAKDDTFEIIYKVKGKGTKFLASLKSGSKADVIGPFGNGFTVENKKSLLIGCGVGVAPTLFLSNKMDKARIKYSFIPCSQTSLGFSDDYTIITEDGSQGLKGRLDNYLEDIINKEKPEKIYTCGPNQATAYICQVAQKHNIPVEAALEREFACGTGVCMGCVIQIKQDGNIVNKRICKDGPVFKGNDILW